MAAFENVIQVPVKDIEKSGHQLNGNWGNSFFRNNYPIVLELGCGKGEYTVALGEKYHEKNFIGVDIKGARMYTGAKIALEKGLSNIAFLRTNIEFLHRFFGNNEVDEIWLTFPDPQMKKERRRLTSAAFMKMYADILRPGGMVHLKTDSRFLFDYTLAMVNLNKLPIVTHTDNLYKSAYLNELLNIKTFYEKQWIARGIDIKYLSFKPETKDIWLEPAENFEKDSYRSFGRSAC